MFGSLSVLGGAGTDLKVNYFAMTERELGRTSLQEKEKSRILNATCGLSFIPGVQVPFGAVVGSKCGGSTMFWRHARLITTQRVQAYEFQ